MYVQSSGPGMMSGTNIALAVIGILALVALILAATHSGDNDEHVIDAVSMTTTSKVFVSDGLRKKWYAKTIGGEVKGAVGTDDDSIGLVATGFKTGHRVELVAAEIKTGEVLAGNAGAINLEIGTADECAHNGAPNQDASGAILTATNTAGKAIVAANATSAFTDANNSMGLAVATALQSALSATSKIHVLVLVSADPGAPALP